jgi:hypothetical protein
MRYTYGIHQNLSPADLFTYVALDETRKQLGLDDLASFAIRYVTYNRLAQPAGRLLQ